VTHINMSNTKVTKSGRHGSIAHVLVYIDQFNNNEISFDDLTVQFNRYDLYECLSSGPDINTLYDIAFIKVNTVNAMITNPDPTLLRRTIQCFENNNNPLELSNSMSVVYTAMGKYSQNLEYLNKAILLGPNNSRCFSNRGIVLMNMERYNEALCDLDKAINLDDRWPIDYFSRGQTLFYLNRNEEAIEDFSIAIDFGEYDILAYRCRAYINQISQQFDLALQEYYQAIQLDLDIIDALVERCDLLWMLGRYEETISEYTNAMYRGSRSEIDSSRLHVLRANAYYELNNVEDALRDYARAIKLYPVDLSPDWSFVFDILDKYMEQTVEQINPKSKIGQAIATIQTKQNSMKT
jgi:tetratricopeptide (TPR) repeat protein